MITKKTTKNQVTLPKAIVERVPSTNFFDIVVNNSCNVPISSRL